MNKYDKEDILAIIISFILILGFYFLVASGAVALASYCFGFNFAWKYVWLVWFIMMFVIPILKYKGD